MNFKQYYNKKNNLIILFIIILFILSSLFLKKIYYLDFNSIFFKKGIFLFGKSIIIYFYSLFFLGLISIIILSVKNKIKNIFILALLLYVILFFVNIIEYNSITIKGLKTFTFINNESKSFFGYDNDYLIFTYKIRKYLGLDSLNRINRCSIYIFSNNNTLENYWKLVYLKPCKVINEIEKSDYIIYYKKNVPKSLINKIILKHNDNYLIKM